MTIYTIFVLLILTFSSLVVTGDNDNSIYLDNNDSIIIVCNYSQGDRTYNVTNVNGELVVEEIIYNHGNWSNWSPWWVMENAEPVNNTVSYICRLFGGFVMVEPQQADWIILRQGWNIVVPENNILVSDIMVRYSGKEMTWEEANRARIVYRYVFTMEYKRVSYLYEGVQYRMYAYRNCEINMK